MRISDDKIEEVRTASDIVDIVGSYVHLTKKGANYFGLCPFHNEKSPSFSVSQSKQMYYCFGCGAGGNVISFIMEYENYSFMEAVRYLAEKAGIELPEDESEEEKKEASLRAKILEVNKAAAYYYYNKLKTEAGSIGLKYFKKRQLNDDTIRNFGLGYSGKGGKETVDYLRNQGFQENIIREAGLCNISEKTGMTDRFWNRVMFPIMDINGKVIGFGGRVMGDGEPKYLNSPETMVFDKSHNMYGLNVARKSRRSYRIVCEGYMDVISMHQAGFTEAVASLGTAFTSGHAGLLRRYTKDIRLTYDSDGPGVKAALRAIPICRDAGLSTKIIDLRPYKDPDEFIKNLGAEEFQKRIDEAENSFFFEMRVMQQDYDMNDPGGRTSFHEAMAKRLSKFTDEIERDNYISAVAARYSINENALKKQVAYEEAKQEGIQVTVRTDRKENDKKKADDNGRKKAERYLLTWITDDSSVYNAIKPYLSPKDFSEGICRKVAEILFGQLDNGKCEPASIISMFSDEEEHRIVAAIFNTKLEAVESGSDKVKALTDIVVRIKQESLMEGEHIPEGEDPIKHMIREKNAMESLKKIKINL